MWSSLSLLSKVLLVANTLLVFAITASGVIAYRIAHDAVHEEVVANGTQTVREFASINGIDFENGVLGEGDLKRKLRVLAESDEDRRLLAAYAISPDGKTVIAQSPNAMAIPSLVGLGELTSVRVLIDTEALVIVAAPALRGGRTVGYVVFTYNGERILRSGGLVLIRIGLVIVIAVVVNFVILVFVLRRVLQPVAQLGTASEAFARGDFRRRVEAKSQDEVGRAARSFNEMADKLAVHMRFSNAALMDRIRRGNPDNPQEHQLSVVFGDAVGYTQWSQNHTPNEIFEMLSRYYTCMGRITVGSFQGIIDKFIGDGIMMHFGMMSDSERVDRAYVRNALRATIYSQFALRIMSYVIEEMENRQPLNYRFGLASGKCMMGPLGAQRIMLDYSIVGNVVNLASRLEGKAPAGGLLIDRFTRIDAGDGFIEVADSGRQKVKGVPEPIQVYSVRGFSADYEMEAMERFLSEDFFEDGLIQTTLLPQGRLSKDRLNHLRAFIRRSIIDEPYLPIATKSIEV